MRVVETNHQLVLAARIPGYQPAALDDLLYVERRAVEVIARNKYIVPIEDYGLFRVRFREMELRQRPQIPELEPMMARVMERISAEGPLSSLDFEEDDRVSGWWEPDGQGRTRAIRQAMDWLWHFGRLAVSHRSGARRYFDLPERLLGCQAVPECGSPDDSDHRPGLDAEQLAAMREGLLRKYVRAAGLVDIRDWGFGWSKYTAAEKRQLVEQLVEGGHLLPVEIEGVRTTYYVPAAEAGDLAAAADIEPAPDLAILPPLDNLIWLRGRTAELFGFEYTWEAYTPADKRKYGAYTCPILGGDELVGRIDAAMDRPNGSLAVGRVWWEPGHEWPRHRDELDDTLLHLASVCGGDRVTYGEGAP